jgi:outer membrane protein TolC
MKRICLLLIICCTSGFAQTRFNNLNECLAYSKQNNSSLKINHLNHQVSQERVKAAWAAMMPQVKLFSNIDNNLNLPVQLVPAQLLGGAEGEYVKVQFGTQYSVNYGAEASLSLINISNWKNIRSAEFAEKVSLSQREDMELNINEQLITAYYFALLSRESIALNKDLVSSADSLLKAAEIRLANGLIEPLEYNRVKSIYIESAQQLTESKASFDKNLNTLKSLSGLHVSDSLVLTESIKLQLNESFHHTVLATTVTQLPRYKMFSNKTFQSLEDLKRQRAKVLPEVSLYGRVSRQSFSNTFDFFRGDQPWFDVAAVGVRAEWNLFTGFARQSNIRQASLQGQIAKNELEDYALKAERELETLRIEHTVAAQGVQQFTEHFKLNSVNQRIAGEKYKQGVYTIDQYVTIYQETVRSQNQYLSKLANYLVYESIVQARNTLQ